MIYAIYTTSEVISTRYKGTFHGYYGTDTELSVDNYIETEWGFYKVLECLTLDSNLPAVLAHKVGICFENHKVGMPRDEFNDLGGRTLDFPIPYPYPFPEEADSPVTEYLER